MAKEICISSTPHETRLAILEDDQLAEIYYERENEYTLAGSIYNGRVTRVLPGMQSAFVDLGLERDAFLYVTDFIELEDQGEEEELEKAAAGGQAPREVRQGHGGDRNGGRRDERSQRGGQRHDAPASQFQPIEEAATGTLMPPAHEESPAAGQTESAREQSDGEGGARRWRGRRRRRGGRGSDAMPGGRLDTDAGSAHAAEALTPAEPAIHAAAAPPVERSGRGHQTEAPFVLPGESISRYGGSPAAETPKSASAAIPPRRASTSKPSTLIEAPLAWDGSGLLPGESLSRHRSRGPEPEAEASDGEEQNLAAAPIAHDAPEEFAEEFEEPAPGLEEIERSARAAHEEPALEFDEEENFDEEPLETPFDDENELTETAEGTDDLDFEELALPDPQERESASEPEKASAARDEDSDASASHRVDPSSPSGFRLFGFGKKKKEDDEGDGGAKTSAPAAPVSSYAPGNGVVEEEVIEGEEFDAAPHARRHKSEMQDLDTYEEETLPSHMRTGELGEMLQEAHLDHRIQRDFDEKGGEIEVEELETVEEEEAPVGAQAAPGRDRRERGGRGQRERGRGPHGQRRGPARRSAQTSNLPIISDLLKPGQEILVQIAKEPIAKKGARITSHIALPGRFLVFMPTVSHVGVSRKIASDEERHRLKRILLHERGEASGGFIVRTAAEGASEEELRADLRFLMNLWNDIKQRSESSKSPALIYHDLSLIERILRDQVSDNFTNIWVDTEGDYERIVRFLNRFSPSLVRRVKLYTKETPLFEHFGIQDEISKALRSKVWLKSGGSIVINQTEALVAIDINTGKYVGKSARLEDTILKTNLDAVPEIVRQIRLRDLGGIIVIDFIDMDERKNRFKVMAALEEALKNDRAPTKVLQFNDFGLVAITRKRVKQSLERTLSTPCPTCQATGMVKSPATVCNEIYIELRKMRKHFESADVMLRVNPETVKVLKSNSNRWLNDFEELVGKNILVKSDPTLHPEQFDIQG
jgi:Rne/Rng family ribonuclease